MASNLLTWLFLHHSFFRALQQDIVLTLRRHSPLTLDDLVIYSRRPVRTVLLALDFLRRKGDVTFREGVIGSGTTVPRSGTRVLGRSPSPSLHEALLNTYISCAKDREEPVLLWTQRRLVPSSAIDRGLYIQRQVRGDMGAAVFLGDDDLVSPLVAALLPNWDIEVIDIDSEVLRKVSTTADILGTTVTCNHVNLASRASWEREYDLVVCDPFPSGDGAFEEFFWSRASAILKPGGLLISTIAPSHKPHGYELNALRSLHRRNLILLDLQADFGMYETFPFEFSEYESTLINSLGLSSAVSQTKSLFTAWQGDAKNRQITSFDFEALTHGTAKHYLTAQAGCQHQITLAATRGVAEGTPAACPHTGLQVELFLDRSAHKDMIIDELLEQLARRMAVDGLSLQGEEREEIARLKHDATIPVSDVAVIGLAARAVESWTRWSMQEFQS